MIDFKSFEEFEENRPMSIGERKKLEEFTKAAMQGIVTGIVTRGTNDINQAAAWTIDIGEVAVWIAGNTIKALNEEVNKDGSN